MARPHLRTTRSAGEETFARVYRWRILSTVHTGITRVGYFLIWVVPSGAVSFHIHTGDRTAILGMVALYSVVGGVAARRQSRRAFAPVQGWLDSGRPPTVEEQESLLAQPRHQARGTLLYWAVGGLIGAVQYLLLFDWNIGAAGMIFMGMWFLGSHAAAFTYFLVERALRPVAAYAMVSSQPVRLTIMSVRNRFLMAFVFGPGITIAGIAMFLTLHASPGLDLAPAVWPVIVLGVVDGYLLVVLAASSVTEPMTSVREAMKRVFEGDLDSAVPVDAGSEVGLLQVGFNRMLTGLRERERLRQLLDHSAGGDVAERLVARGSDFEGNEVEASVLMIDLVGSTAMTEADRKDVLTTLNCLFDAVVRVTAEHGGWVNRFVGDAALCIFGAPVADADHATKALAAARALNDELWMLRKERPWLDVGVAVSSGPVIAADIGTAARFEFTIIGDAPNEAARLTEVAKHAPARVVASGASVAAAAPAEAERWVASREVTLRGKSVPTEVFEPLAALAALVEEGDRTGSPRLAD